MFGIGEGEESGDRGCGFRGGLRAWFGKHCWDYGWGGRKLGGGGYWVFSFVCERVGVGFGFGGNLSWGGRGRRRDGLGWSW